MTPAPHHWHQPLLARRIGAAHQRRGAPCQDACGWQGLRDAAGDPVQVLVVSDGHGGARYRRSDVGSHLACAVALREVERALAAAATGVPREKGSGPAGWAEWLAWELPERIVAGWCREVEAYGRAHPDGESPAQRGEAASTLLYGATLGVLVLTPHWWGHTGLGDWDLVRVAAGGEAELLSEEPEQDGASEATHSLCMPRAERRFAARSGLHRLTALDPPFQLVLCTDGIRKSCGTDEDFLTLAGYLAELGAGKTPDLERALDLITREGSGDDVSAVIARWQASEPAHSEPAPARHPDADFTAFAPNASAPNASERTAPERTAPERSAAEPIASASWASAAAAPGSAPSLPAGAVAGPLILPPEPPAPAPPPGSLAAAPSTATRPPAPSAAPSAAPMAAGDAAPSPVPAAWQTGADPGDPPAVGGAAAAAASSSTAPPGALSAPPAAPVAPRAAASAPPAPIPAFDPVRTGAPARDSRLGQRWLVAGLGWGGIVAAVAALTTWGLKLGPLAPAASPPLPPQTLAAIQRQVEALCGGPGPGLAGLAGAETGTGPAAGAQTPARSASPGSAEPLVSGDAGRAEATAAPAPGLDAGRLQRIRSTLNQRRDLFARLASATPAQGRAWLSSDPLSALIALSRLEPGALVETAAPPQRSGAPSPQWRLPPAPPTGAPRLVVCPELRQELAARWAALPSAPATPAAASSPAGPPMPPLPQPASSRSQPARPEALRSEAPRSKAARSKAVRSKAAYSKAAYSKAAYSEGSATEPSATEAPGPKAPGTKALPPE